MYSFSYVLLIINSFSVTNLIFVYFTLSILLNLKYYKKINFKAPKSSFSNSLLAMSLVFGFYMRIHNSYDVFQLRVPDAYAHLAMLDAIINGHFTGGGVIDRYDTEPRGFHLISAVIAKISKVKTYTLARYMGPIFGTFSILGLYVLLSELRNETTASFAALLYSSFYIEGYTFGFTQLIRRQTFFITESLGFVFLPIMLLLGYRILNSKVLDRYLDINILFFIFLSIGLSLSVPLTQVVVFLFIIFDVISSYLVKSL